MKNISLSYYDYSNYITCPRRYFYEQTTEEMPLKDDRTAISGTVIQKALEIYVKSGLYKNKEFNYSWFETILPQIHTEVCAKKHLPWEEGEEKRLLQSYQDQLPLIGHVFMEYGYNLADDFTTEVTLKHVYRDNFFIIGRLDFRLKQGDEVIILDGKNSKYGLKYLNENQLLWYSLLEYKNTNKLPTKLGFWLYRDGLVHYIHFDEKIVSELEESILGVADSILLDWRHIDGQQDMNAAMDCLKAKPTAYNCKFCLFKDVCSAYKQWQKDKRIKVVVPDIYGQVEVDFI